VGVGVIFILGIITIMIIPVAHADIIDDMLEPFREKHPPREKMLEKELDRLNEKYDEENENEKVVDPIDTMNDRITLHKERVILLDELLITQNELLLAEKSKLEKQQEKYNESWGNTPPDYTIFDTLNYTLNDYITERDITNSKIKTSILLLDMILVDAKIIGVQLSPTCEKMVIHNIPSNCPTYEELESLDNSNYSISGKFSFHDGWYHREKSTWGNEWGYYEEDENIRIILNPHFDMGIRHKMITIENTLGYFSTAQDKITDNKIATLHHDRIIKDCNEAYISADSWKVTLPDTIFTFRNGCENSNYDDTFQFYLPSTPMDKTIFTEIKHQSWLKDAMIKCKVKC
jgi:hypothetical protein